jgi:hypothetical protein
VLATAGPRPLAAANLKFNYDGIAEEERKATIAAALQIKAHTARTTESILVIGRLLSERKAALPHGQFTAWIDSEFENDLSPRNAQYFMQIYERFAGQPAITSIFNVEALRLLSAPGTPEITRNEIIERAAATGAAPSTRAIKAQIAAAKPPKIKAPSHLKAPEITPENLIDQPPATATRSVPSAEPEAPLGPEEIQQAQPRFSAESLILHYHSTRRTLDHYIQLTGDSQTAGQLRQTLDQMIERLGKLV